MAEQVLQQERPQEPYLRGWLEPASDMRSEGQLAPEMSEGRLALPSQSTVGMQEFTPAERCHKFGTGYFLSCQAMPLN